MICDVCGMLESICECEEIQDSREDQISDDIFETDYDGDGY